MKIEDDYLGGKLTYLLAADDDNNYYALYYLDSTEVYNEDTFTAYVSFHVQLLRLIT